MVLTSISLGVIVRVERSAPTAYRHPRQSRPGLRGAYLLALLVAATAACQGLPLGSGKSVTSDAHPDGARSAASAAVQGASGGGSSSTGSEEQRTASALAATDHLLTHTAGRRLSGKKGGKKLQGVEYDSRGKVSHFKGDVYPTPALALALANRSYRKELILITDTRARAALQTYYQLESMGLVHALWLTHSHTACDAAEQLHAVRLRQRQKQRGAGGGSGGNVASVEDRKKRSLAGAGGTVSGVVEDGPRRRLAAGEGLWFAGGGALDQGSGAGAGATGIATAAAASTSTITSSSTAEAGNISASPASAALTTTTSGVGAGADSTAVAATAGTAGTSSAVDGDFLGCAWYSQPFPAGFGGHRRLMMKRVMLLARAVRLGYNVLSLDTDVIVYRNPYSYLKSPPYSSMHMVVGKSVVGVVVNTGVVYVQGAARHGPVAWLLAEVVDRNLRWIEHNVSMPHMAQALGGGAAGPGAVGGAAARLVLQHADSRGCWDQYLFADVVLTGMLKKLVLMYCARPPSDKGAPKQETTWNDRHRAALGLSGNDSPKNLMATMETEAKSDPQLRQLVGADKYETTWLNLSIPHATPPLLPDEPGYALPGAQRGRTAESFQQVLAADDKHSELRKGRARALQQQQQQQGEGQGQRPAVERLAYAADWLIGGWSQRGAQGYWDPDLTKGKPKQVFAHLVRAPGPTHIGKDAVRMLYGQYDWSVARLTSGGVAPFLGWSNPAALPKVFALSPDVDTSTISNHQWSNMARGLVQVALLTGRMVVWPEVPCAGGWVQPNPGARKGLPLNTNAKFVTRGPFGEGLRCTPVTTFHQKCLYERHVVHRVGGENGTVQGRGGAAAAAAALAAGSSAEDVGAALAAGAMGWDTESGAELGEYVSRVEGPRGMLWPEFRELLRLLQLGRDMNSVLPEAEAVRAAARGSVLADPLPGQHNTVSLAANDDYDEGERPIMFDEPPRTPGITYVRASDALKALSAYSEHHVLYLAQRTFLTQLDKAADAELMARYRTFRGECPALK